MLHEVNSLMRSFAKQMVKEVKNPRKIDYYKITENDLRMLARNMAKSAKRIAKK